MIEPQFHKVEYSSEIVAVDVVQHVLCLAVRTELEETAKADMQLRHVSKHSSCYCHGPYSTIILPLVPFVCQTLFTEGRKLTEDVPE